MTQGNRSTVAHAPSDDAPANHADAAVPLDVTALADLLEEHLYDRGNDVRTWPADEAAAYRELGWSEGTAAARRVMFEKAARALLNTGIALSAGEAQERQVTL